MVSVTIGLGGHTDLLPLVIEHMASFTHLAIDDLAFFGLTPVVTLTHNIFRACKLPTLMATIETKMNSIGIINACLLWTYPCCDTDS